VNVCRELFYCEQSFHGPRPVRAIPAKAGMARMSPRQSWRFVVDHRLCQAVKNPP
jgi:hypothetical protein